uniref:Trichohyalin-plectin-homology domain-containing protein n=1 Tax=Alexandrium monilatum TaxID=311494 RepID=A0A7S4QJB0_9DINO|mmetsp:Transcript_25080/g.74842  ORF Transcript_25080/g.74842 Transcript_25080/m.74842 type:complete len:524 (-) Transcript_25080:80-1651(-)
MAASLVSFEETNPRAVINSPRSLQACKQEGVLPQELIYKPIEAFQEKNLSPRLVKLRYDFFEAKRRDLLAASRRARDGILADERRERESGAGQLDVLSRDSGLTRGAVLALQSDGLKQERQKLLRAQENERNWLKAALNNELNQLKLLETNNQALSEAARSDQEKQLEKARLMKELNDRRQQDEERKAMEAEARQRLEKQIAKEEFHRQQEELRKKQELEAQKQKEAYERQLKEMERKRQAEVEKAEKKEAMFREQEARRAEMRAQDLKRQDIMEQQKQSFQQTMAERKEARDVRIYQSIQTNMELEQRRREEFDERQRQDQLREERLLQARALEQEESAKRSFQTMMRRRVIQEEAARRSEERRLQILEQQEETEMRLLDHEQKKERYLDFKRELDGLRGKNKEINVERQRRREEAGREMVAEQVRKKDEKIDALNQERKRLWQIRRQAQSEAYRARELVKNEIMRQRITSRYDSKLLESKLNSLMQHDLFTPKVLQTSTSLPLLHSSMQASNASQVPVDPL